MKLIRILSRYLKIRTGSRRQRRRTARDHAPCTLQREFSSIPSTGAPRELAGEHCFPCDGCARGNPFPLGPVTSAIEKGIPPSVNPWPRLTRSFRKSDLAPLCPLKGMTPISYPPRVSYFRPSMLHTATSAHGTYAFHLHGFPFRV